MAYEKQNWKTGDIVTSAKLNHMEDGIAGGYLIVTATDDAEAMTFTLDKTWNEIKAALDAKIPCYIYKMFVDGEDYGRIIEPITSAMYNAADEEHHYVIFDVLGEYYYAVTPDDYPVFSYA